MYALHYRVSTSMWQTLSLAVVATHIPWFEVEKNRPTMQMCLLQKFWVVLSSEHSGFIGGEQHTAQDHIKISTVGCSVKSPTLPLSPVMLCLQLWVHHSWPRAYCGWTRGDESQKSGDLGLSSGLCSLLNWMGIHWSLANTTEPRYSSCHPQSTLMFYPLCIILQDISCTPTHLMTLCTSMHLEPSRSPWATSSSMSKPAMMFISICPLKRAQSSMRFS